MANIIEIERRFIVGTFPENLKLKNERLITQSYLAIGDEEFRIREIILKNGVKYTMTLKKGKGMKRKEYKLDISPETYKQLKSMTPDKGLVKQRADFKFDGIEYEVDMYLNAHESGLKIVELEFPTLKKAKAFKPPAWFGEEVTEIFEYSNQQLWRTSVPYNSVEQPLLPIEKK